MIKPIELFQGAIVRYERFIFRVSGVVEEDIIDGQSYKGVETAIYLKKPHSQWRIPPESQKKIKGVTLTPEMAKKLGFRRGRESSHEYEYYKRGVTELWFYKGKVNTVWYRRKMLLPVEILTVHELQRTLAEKTRIRLDFSKLLK